MRLINVSYYLMFPGNLITILDFVKCMLEMVYAI